MSIKDYLMKKMLAQKMKDVPQVDQDKMFAMIEKNPDLFQKIAVEVQAEMKNGTDQMSATMKVVKQYEEDLKKLAN